MNKSESQAYIDKMYEERGRSFSFDFHQVLAAEDLDFLKAYNQMIEACYIDRRILDNKTKEIIYMVALTSVKASVEQIQAHVKLAVALGATKHEILEALEICLPIAGVPAFMIGFEAWKRVVSPDKVEPTH